MRRVEGKEPWRGPERKCRVFVCRGRRAGGHEWCVEGALRQGGQGLLRGAAAPEGECVKGL